MSRRKDRLQISAWETMAMAGSIQGQKLVPEIYGMNEPYPTRDVHCGEVRVF